MPFLQYDFWDVVWIKVYFLISCDSFFVHVHKKMHTDLGGDWWGASEEFHLPTLEPMQLLIEVAQIV